jgi:hypothetical protein
MNKHAEGACSAAWIQSFAMRELEVNHVLGRVTSGDIHIHPASPGHVGIYTRTCAEKW